jgi:hypothetical protein
MSLKDNERHSRAMLICMNVCMFALVIKKGGGDCSGLALSIWNGDTMSLLLIFDVITFVILAFGIVIQCHCSWISVS